MKPPQSIAGHVTIPRIFLALTLAIFMGANTATGNESLSARVLTVRDGDTIVVSASGEKKVVRLIGIDCPELGKNGAPDEFMAMEAKKLVADLISEKDVDLTFDMEREDRYGRWLCYVFTEKGEMVNELLLKKGLALTITYFPFREKKRFLELQGEAEMERKGLFRDLSPHVADYSSAHFEGTRVYPGPSRTFIVAYEGLAKPWLKEAELAGEIERIRRYARQYPPSLVKTALETDGYMPLREEMTQKKDDGKPLIGYKEAGNHVGRYVTLEGEIRRAKNTGKVTFLNFDQDWQNSVSVVIFAEDALKFPLPPEKLFPGKTVEVTGKVKVYKGRPEIIVRDPRNIRIIEKK